VTLRDGRAHVDGVRIAVRLDRRAIAGTVVDAHGAPLSDIRVSAMALDPGAEPLFRSWVRLPGATTDAAGAFEIEGLATGTYALRARTPAGGEAIVSDVAAGSRHVVVRITEPGTIEGQLLGFTGRPPVLAQSVLGDFEVITGRVEGTDYRIEGLSPGRYTVTAMLAGEGDGKQVTVSSGQATRLDLSSSGSGAFAGVVRDFGTGQPVAGMGCLIAPFVDGVTGITRSDRSFRTGSDGVYVADPAPAGHMSAYCYADDAPGYSSGRADALIPAGGKVSAEIRVVRREGGAVGTIGVGLNSRFTPPYVVEVRPGSPGAKAGLRPLDRIVALDGASVVGLTSQAVTFLIANRDEGTTLEVTYVRDGAGGAKTVSMVVGRE
jgi:hypothetical protein